MRPTVLTTLALAAVIAALAAQVDAAMVLHSTMDNSDVGAGAGTDSTQNGTFQVRDSAGSAENGTAGANAFGTPAATSSAHITSGATGRIGQALAFPSEKTDDRGVSYGDVWNPGTGSYTVALWFDALDLLGNEIIAAKGNDDSNGYGWSIFTSDATLGVRARALTGEKAGMSDTIVNASVFHHIAMVIDRDANKLFGYLDGALMANVGGFGAAGNTLPSAADVTSPVSLVLGLRSRNDFELQGLIDDFAIFDEPLSASTIADIYQGGLDGRDVAQVTQSDTVPVPATWALATLGLVGLQLVRRRGAGPAGPRVD